MIPVPNPLPEPNPRAGHDDYESQFNTRYYQTRRKELQPFFYGRPGSESGTELTQDEKWDLADSLYEQKIPFDQEIEAEGMAPYVTMFMRQERYNYTRVPVGMGRQKGPATPVDPNDFKGPVIPGYLPVTCDINELK